MGLGLDLKREERIEYAILLMKGIKSKTDEVGCKVIGGQTVVNPWFIIGGTAITTVDDKCITKSHDFKAG